MESQPLVHTHDKHHRRRRYMIGIVLLFIVGSLFGMTYYAMDRRENERVNLRLAANASTQTSQLSALSSPPEAPGETHSYTVEEEYHVPCLYEGLDNPPGCVQRFVLCGSTSLSADVLDLIEPDNNTHCSDFPVRLQQTYIVQFYGGDGRCWEIKAKIGECWGLHPSGSNYGCMGKCGPGCGNTKAGAWARDCFRHDVCSWFFSSSGGRFDDHCGKEFQHAAPDYLSNRLCSATNGNDHLVCP